LEDYKVNTEQVDALADVLGCFTENSITKIYLNNNGMADEDMKTLLKGVQSNKFIKCLEIANNRLGEQGICALCSFFNESRRQIKSLILSGTKTNKEHTDLLCQSLSEYKYLQELRLSNFKMGTEAVEAITLALDSNSNLEILDLSWNSI